MSAEPDLVHPDLYAARPGGMVNLLGMTCGRCGHVAFPRQRNGCEKCGATDADPTNDELVCRGTLVSYATVHMHQAKTIAAPFVIGEVKLDRGPTLRATMVEATDAALRCALARCFLLRRRQMRPAVGWASRWGRVMIKALSDFVRHVIGIGCILISG
jgi:ribosomal protein S27AE